MTIGPHPHIGIATVSWLFSGSLVHFDTLANVAPLESGGVNVMTAGRGIAHAEVGAPEGARLHGIQLWLALDEVARHDEASFSHRDRVPSRHFDNLIATAFIGALPGEPLHDSWSDRALAAQLDLAGTGRCTLDPTFEHGLFVIDGTVNLDGLRIAAGEALHLGAGRRELALASSAAARLVLLGGPPFVEELIMWWNFVARTDEEIRAAAAAWSTQIKRRPLAHSGLAPVPPPPLPTTRLVARPSGGGRA
jgi:redox-sensitive bicupin YhaK (pirin superfamily)